MKARLFERRIRRSNDRLVALRYQLESSRVAAELDAVVLADAHGKLVAQAGDPLVCAELSVSGPILERSFMSFRMPSLVRDANVAVRPLKMNGQALTLACASKRHVADSVLSDSAEGIARILQAM